MTLLSRKADYALLILSYLHQAATGGTARAIADKFGISRAFVANILKELCQSGFVLSHRGVKGGYVLARSAATITLAELLEAVEDGFGLTMCSPGATQEHANCAMEGVCTLKGPMVAVHQQLLDVLRGITLAALFDSSGREPGRVSGPTSIRSLPLLAGESAEPAMQPFSV